MLCRSIKRRLPFVAVSIEWLLLLIIFSLAGCRNSEAPNNPVSLAMHPPHWVRQASPVHSQVAVVFVHGIYGDSEDTWKNAHGVTFFQLLEQTDIGNKVDIYTFGYETNMFKDGSLNIRDAAGKLEDYLKDAGVWSYPKVVFVAHSMGGLIVMRELDERRDHLKKVPLIVFYATPQEGATVANVSKFVAGNNPALKELTSYNGNEFLQDLSNDWLTLDADDRPAIMCARETAPTKGILIVPLNSASRFCTDTPRAIGNTDHITIVKPEDAHQPAVVFLVNSLKDYVFGWPDKPVVSSPDLTLAEGAWRFSLRDPYADNVIRVRNNSLRLMRLAPRVASESANLRVFPDDEGGIPAHHVGGFRILIRPSRIEPQYTFSLEDAPFSMRVLVAVEDVQSAQASQDAALRRMASALSAHLDADPSKLDLGKEERAAQLAEIANTSLIPPSSALSRADRWVVTADALASIGLTEIAESALSNAVASSPSIKRVPSARAVANLVAAQGGKKFLFDEGGLRAQPQSPAPISPPLVQETRAANIGAMTELSDQLRDDPHFKAYGYSLEGDVLQAEGKPGAAKKAYLKSNELHPSPLSVEKLHRADQMNMQPSIKH